MTPNVFRPPAMIFGSVLSGAAQARVTRAAAATSSPTFSSLYIDTISTAHQLHRTVPSAILESSRIMRLLHFNNDGDFSLTEFFEDDIPEYAILSHRWGAEEVTFKDMTDGTSKATQVKPRLATVRYSSAENRRGVMAWITSGWTHAASTNRAALSS
ncbi:uncharacterized protein LY89DRAFT_738484 [Mollisia scopiformis]|uniref:Uncharacterized protein n=1 Tax=Mollisia scopiformis TaxID=149040 RepID=A0A194WV42_MOLSC|nr:uncharacterized protein LY89DRAFT_738484 [Mollisia scopiformis]KUJ11838.1 hypothetical protein LY89DRAFT_738484 [Mollisia scopiformis]